MDCWRSAIEGSYGIWCVGEDAMYTGGGLTGVVWRVDADRGLQQAPHQSLEVNTPAIKCEDYYLAEIKNAVY